MNARSFFRHGLALLGMTTVSLADPTPAASALAAWSVLGADKAQLTAADTLSLPASAQLYRTVAGNRIALNVESRPVFGQASADLPVVELGDAAVAFLRQGDVGKLVLVLGHNPAFALPYEIALDGEGRSAEPLALTVGREGAIVAVTARGQTLQFPAGYSARPQEVVLSAGAGRAWDIGNLALEVGMEPPTEPGDGGGQGSAGNGTDQIRQAAADVSEGSGGVSAGASDGVAATESTAEVNSAEPPTSSTLEIFTPPSVRVGRAAAVRAAVIESLQK